MSSASHMISHLRTLYGVVLGRVLSLIEQRAKLRRGHSGPDADSVLEQLEPRVLLSYSPYGEELTPSQMCSAYGFNQVYFGSVPGTGRGETVAVIDLYDDPAFFDSSDPTDYAQSDLYYFDQQFGLPDFGGTGPTFTKVGQNGGPPPTTTDPNGPVWDHGGNTFEEEEAMDVEWVHAIAPQANIMLVEVNTKAELYPAAAWAASQRNVVAVSMSFGGPESSGETSYDSDFTTPTGHPGVTFLAGSGDNGTALYPACSPNVVSVGGTILTLNGSTYSETAWPDSGGGISLEPQPPYQKGVVGVENLSTTNRTVPDVAMDAAPNTQVAVYDSWDWPPASYNNPWNFKGNGTSLATPIWAGLIAIVDQGRMLEGKSSLDGATQTLPSLYHLPSSDFNGLDPGYSGYNIRTGLGSPVANKLIPDLVGPANDDFDSAVSLSGFSATASGTNLNATSETGEPSNCGDSDGHSVWWKWTAPASGSVQIDTIGSTFDTTLGVYTGGSVSSLTTVASNDNSDAGLCSKVTFNVVSGTTYDISVDGTGANGGTGFIRLNVNLTGSVSVNITSPASNFTTNQSSITLSGTTSSNTTTVSWHNLTTGGNGTASGTTSWSVPTIPLASGNNTIEVMATDGQGDYGYDSRVIYYNQNAVQPTLYTTALAWVASGIPNKTIGSSGSPYLGYDPNNYSGDVYDDERTAAMFDISGIPAGSTISSATLYATVNGADPSNAPSFSATPYALETPWTQSGVSWNGLFYEEGITDSGSTATISSSKGTIVTWNVTAMVKAWFLGTLANDGLVLVSNVEGGGSQNDRYFLPSRTSLSITYIPETIPPHILITEPVSQGTYSTTQATVSLAGTASDNDQVATVAWLNGTTGVTGTATGTTSWSASVPLAAGENDITVRAYDRAGNTASQILKVFYTPPDTTPPAQPTGLVATLESRSSVNLTWNGTYDTGGSGLAGYNIYRDGTLIDQVGANVLTYTDSGPLASGTTYTYTITAFDGNNNVSLASDPATCATPAPSAGLELIQQPTTGAPDAGLAPGFIVEIVDSTGNLESFDNSDVTISIATGPTGAILSGTLTVAATGGIAMFGNLSLDTVGNYTLIAASTGLTSAASAPFIVQAPTVSSVNSTTPNGSYKAGTVIPITIAFSENVTVNTAGGTPTLSLSDGGTATYVSGSGTSTLTFNYTVASGENNSQLDYASTTALILNGGTIQDAAGGDAILTLASPGSAGSLGANTTIVIDTEVPSVTVSTLVTNNNTPTLTGTVADPTPSSGIATVMVVVNGQTFPATVTGGTWSVTVPTALPDGTYNVMATATDNAGNSGGATNELTVDTIAPVVTVNALVTNDNMPTLTGTVADGSPSSGIAVVGVQVNGQILIATVIGATWNVPVPTALPDGAYSVVAATMDSAGNIGSNTAANRLNALIIDTIAPSLTVNPLVTNQNKPTLTGTVTDPAPSSGIASVVVVVNGQNLQATVTGVVWSVTVPTLLQDRTYNVQATAMDNAGNIAKDSATNDLTVDTTPPMVTVNTLKTTNPTPILSGAVIDLAPSSDIASVRVNVDGQNLVATVTGNTWSVAVPTALPGGTYNVTATATDNAGNSASDSTTNELFVGLVDLAASFSSTLKLPATLQSGGGTVVTVPVVVTNVGNVPTLATTPKIEIVIEAVDSVTGDKTVLQTLTGQSVSSLASNKSKTFSTTVTLPPGMTPDAYNLEVVEDVLNVVTDDTNAANNTFITSGPAGTFNVTEGNVNLTGTFGSTWTLPPSVVQNTGMLKGNISVVVTNTGDVAMPTGQQVNVEMWAYDTTNPGNSPILLGTLAKQSVSKLAPNGSTKLTFSPAVAANTYLPPDTYNICANIVPLQMTGLPALVESNPDNWVIAPSKTVISSGLFVDLSAGFGSTMKLPAGGTSGDGKLITVPVVVQNVGNEPIPTGDKISIEIDAFDGTTTTPLKTLTGQSVSLLGAGKSATFSTTVTLPFGLVGGTYNIVAKVDTTDVVTGDTNPANNTVMSATTIAVAQGLVNLSASTLGISTLPASLASGALLKGTVSVTMKNTGTVAMPAGQSATIQLVAYDAATDTYVPLGTLDSTLTAALAVNATKLFTVKVNLPAGLAAGNYQLEATITPDSNMADFTAGLYTVLLNALGKTLNIKAN